MAMGIRAPWRTPRAKPAGVALRSNERAIWFSVQPMANARRRMQAIRSRSFGQRGPGEGVIIVMFECEMISRKRRRGRA